jgi:prepilin-type processing-associated H-X9-DG protein
MVPERSKAQCHKDGYMKTHAKKNPGAPGFSRAEVLVLIAFVVVVGVLAIPSLMSESRRVSRQRSLNNLIQWGIALNLHLMENRDRLPSIGGVIPSIENVQAWYNALPPYLNAKPLGELRADEFPKAGEASLWIDPAAREPREGPLGSVFFTYAMNRWLQPNPERPAYKVFSLDDPTATVFMVEVAGYDPGALPNQVDFRQAEDASPGNGAAHVLFVDGHVECVPKSHLLALTEIAVEADDVETSSGKWPRWMPFEGAPVPRTNLAGFMHNPR